MACASGLNESGGAIRRTRDKRVPLSILLTKLFVLLALLFAGVEVLKLYDALARTLRQLLTTCSCLRLFSLDEEGGLLLYAGVDHGSAYCPPQCSRRTNLGGMFTS